MIKDNVRSHDDVRKYYEHAAELAGMFVEDTRGLEMDGSLDSIRLVELAVAENRRQITPNWFQKIIGAKPSQVEIDEMALWYGCYVGEVLTRIGEWEWNDDPDLGFVLRMGEEVHQPDSQIRARFTDEKPVSLIDVYCNG